MLLFDQYTIDICQIAKWYTLLYYYNTEYTIKHFASCYNTDISTKIKSWFSFLLVDIISDLSA